MKLIVNIPAYNEEKKISETIARIKKSFENEFYQKNGVAITKKLIQIVDDGSTDKTVEKAKAAGADLIVSYKPNRRLAYSFKRAVENSLENRADFMVNIDADGQFNPEDIPVLLEPIIKGQCDMVIANRFGKHEAKNMPFIKYFLNRLGAKMVGFFLNQQIDDLTCGFRAHSQEALLKLNLTNVHFTYTQETIIDAIGKNLKLKWIPVEVSYFTDRKSRIVKSITSFVVDSAKIILRAVRDVRPLKFFGLPGLFFLGIAFFGFSIFLFRYLQTFKITPYLNYVIFSTIFLLLGIQLLIFGLIADMIRSNRQVTEENLYQQRKASLLKNRQ